MKVLKFGGTSVGSPKALKTVFQIVSNELGRSTDIIVVVSAFSGITDSLIDITKQAAQGTETYMKLFNKFKQKVHSYVKKLFSYSEINQELNDELDELFHEMSGIFRGVFLLKEFSPKVMDLVTSFGERISALITWKYFKEKGLVARYLNPCEYFVTDANFGNAGIDYGKTKKKIKRDIDLFCGLLIMPGFIGCTQEGIITTLGRGGSDLSATLPGSILNSEEVQIWTDVDGVLTADPKKVPEAYPIDHLSYEEVMELTHFGAKVLYPGAIQPAKEANIPIRILNTFNRSFKGTIICKKESRTKGRPVAGIASMKNISLIRLEGSGMVGVSGISGRMFTALAREKINAILITQASSEHSICVAVLPEDAMKAKKILEEEFYFEILTKLIDGILIEQKLSTIAVVGKEMRYTPGISGRLFSALGKNGINVVAIAQGSSEMNISIVVDRKDEVKTLNVLHEAFFLSDKKIVNIFLAGTGLIGSKLIQFIRDQSQNLLREQKIELKVVAIANSRKMLIEDNGIDLSNWKDLLGSRGKKANTRMFFDKCSEINLPNSIFVDCTASEEVALFYEYVLYKNISVVAASKVANTISWEFWKRLRDAVKRRNVLYLYETNVCAGLPVINTLRDLLASGDEIIKIEGIFSGTLSYIFNEYTGDNKFVDIVKKAIEKGYSEPDPRLDLKGVDMGRKLLILARETGAELEMGDIEIRNVIPDWCYEVEGVDQFLEKLAGEEKNLEQLKRDAEKEDKKLRFIAEYEKGKRPVIGLRTVPHEHPFSSLKDSDNIVSFWTLRYSRSPLVVKGPGAGADVTAAGVLADIIRVANFYK